MRSLLHLAILAACPLSVAMGQQGDHCTSPLAISDGANGPFSNLNMIPSVGSIPFSCVSPSYFDKDIWLSYRATCNTITIDTCATPATGGDTVLAVYSGACGALTLVA